MKVEVKDGKVTIDIYDLLETMGDDEKTKLAETLSLEGQILRSAVYWLINDFTPNEGYTVYSTAVGGIEHDELRRQLIEGLDSIVGEEVRSLLRNALVEQRKADYYRSLYFKAYHANKSGSPFPDCVNASGEIDYSGPTEEEVKKAMDQIKQRSKA